MSKQGRRPTKAEIEKRRWLIGTAISVIGIILAAAAILPSQDKTLESVDIAAPTVSMKTPSPAPSAAPPNPSKTRLARKKYPAQDVKAVQQNSQSVTQITVGDNSPAISGVVGNVVIEAY